MNSKVISLKVMRPEEAKEIYNETYTHLVLKKLRLKDYEIIRGFLEENIHELKGSKKEFAQAAFENLGKVIEIEIEKLKQLDAKLQILPYYIQPEENK